MNSDFVGLDIRGKGQNVVLIEGEEGNICLRVKSEQVAKLLVRSISKAVQLATGGGLADPLDHYVVVMGNGKTTGAKFAEHKDAVRVAAEYNAAGNCGECYPALVTITPCD